MSTYNFLDKTGLGQVWAKIKALIPTKTSQLTNDSNYITSNEITRVAGITTGQTNGSIRVNTISNGTSSYADVPVKGLNGHTLGADVPSNAVFTNTTYQLSRTDNVITLTGSDGSTSEFMLPVYDGSVTNVVGLGEVGYMTI